MAEQGTTVKGALSRAWNGQERLWKVFWIYGVVVGLVIGFLAGILVLTLFGAEYVPGRIINFVILPYKIWIWVALWRCAFNTNWKILGYVVRVMIALDVIGMTLSVITGSSGIQPRVTG
ncbi:MAG: hypothetical protein H6908_05395 [Hyphomicrobiales bacterium]|nr:hypothetical protein [Hyphomicrobiales bacterium]